jgi:hypothetical protein
MIPRKHGEVLHNICICMPHVVFQSDGRQVAEALIDFWGVGARQVASCSLVSWLCGYWRPCWFSSRIGGRAPSWPCKGWTFGAACSPRLLTCCRILGASATLDSLHYWSSRAPGQAKPSFPAQPCHVSGGLSWSSWVNWYRGKHGELHGHHGAGGSQHEQCYLWVPCFSLKNSFALYLYSFVFCSSELLWWPMNFAPFVRDIGVLVLILLQYYLSLSRLFSSVLSC